MPAFATPAVINPADYANGMWPTTEGTTRYNFRFKASPYYQGYNEGTLAYSSNGVLSWSPAAGYSYYRVSVLPLGGPAYDSIMIDIRDFKTGAVLDVTFNAMLLLDISAEGSSSLTYTTRSQMVLYWFDESFNLLSSENCGVVEKQGSWGADNAVWLLQNSFDMTIPEDAAFVVPRYLAQIYDPDAGDIVKIVASQVPWLDVVVEKDDVNADSLLLESIERELGDLNDTAEDIKSELGDLNDKADTIISGTPEMDDAVNDMNQNIDDQQQAMDDYDAIEKEALQDWEESSAELDSKISNFLKGKGWVQLSALVSPVMNWEHTGHIMIMIIAFVNLSIILFGR